MGHLFKPKLIEEKLENFKIPDFDDKIKTLESWYKLYTSGKLEKKSEKELEQSFNEDILGKILDYTSVTENEIYTREPQPKTPSGGQKADFGLGFFYSYEPEKNSIQAVIEIKGANTSMDKPQKREQNITPVEQAFKYKPFFKDCNFIIVSNFFEIRLYTDSYYDYESWTLKDLLDPSNDYFNFKYFYYLLSEQNFISQGGKSNTQKLLSDIKLESKRITGEFYENYKNLRLELFRDLYKNNLSNEEKKDINLRKEKSNFILEKGQKIIDRIIFIHFCEDLDLLPNGKLEETIDKAKSLVGTSIWGLLQGFFRAIDEGSEKLLIPDGYNGGLFSKDDELRNLELSDEICEKFVNLGDYDFSEDLSVNILGHIFEQSISDLEEIKEKIENDEKIDKKTSKRKQDGIFYTPDYIVDHIVKNSVGEYLQERLKTISKELGLKDDIKEKTYNERVYKAYKKYQAILHDIKVVDPACGSGAFLVKVFDYLLEENIRVFEVLSGGDEGLFDKGDMAKNILQNNIFGVDINEESVEITKLSLWLKTAQKGRKLTNLDENIKCGNSLIDDPQVAGDKAFDWEKEFSNIFDRYKGNNGRIFVDKNINYKELQKLLKKYNHDFCTFNIDGRLNNKNSSDSDIIDLGNDKSSPYYNSKPKRPIVELEPIVFGNTFDDIKIKENDGPIYKRGNQVENSGISIKYNGLNEKLSEYLEKFKHILGKETINNNIKDFLMLLNSILQFEGFEADVVYQNSSSIIRGRNITEKLNYKIFITDDSKGIFTKENKQKIFDKLGYYILSLDEFDSFLGGFDVVVGNPPYLRIQGLQEHHSEDVKYFENNYKSSTGNYDIYALFVENGFNLLKNNGRLGYILPHKFINSEFGKGIRGFLSENKALDKIINFGHNMIFEEASTYTSLLFLQKSKKDFFDYYEFGDLNSKSDKIQQKLNSLTQDDLTRINFDKIDSSPWILTDEKTSGILEKINSMPWSLGDVFDKVFQGIATSGDKVYLIKGTQEGNIVKGYSQQLQKEVEVERGLVKPMLKGEDIKRYAYLQNDHFVIFPYLLEDGEAKPMTEEYIKTNFPKGYKYLKENEDFLRGREKGRMDKEGWFLYIYPKSLNLADVKKIVSPDITLGMQLTVDNYGYCVKNGGYGIMINQNFKEYDKVILSLINSSLMWYFLKNTGTILRGGYFRFNTKYINPFGIPDIRSIENKDNFIEKSDFMLDKNKEFQDKVDSALELLTQKYGLSKISKKLSKFWDLKFSDFKKELKIKKLSMEEEEDLLNWFNDKKSQILNLKSEINNCDKEIDEMVFDLYGLTDEERKVVLEG